MSAAISAPISDNGSIMRFIGRFERLSSPIKVEIKFCPARIPDIKRIVVPEFPQSRASDGADIFPLDLIIKLSLNSASIPKALQTLSEESGSCPFENFYNRFSVCK